MKHEVFLKAERGEKTFFKHGTWPSRKLLPSLSQQDKSEECQQKVQKWKQTLPFCECLRGVKLEEGTRTIFQGPNEIQASFPLLGANFFSFYLIKHFSVTFSQWVSGPDHSFRSVAVTVLTSRRVFHSPKSGRRRLSRFRAKEFPQWRSRGKKGHVQTANLNIRSHFFPFSQLGTIFHRIFASRPPEANLSWAPESRCSNTWNMELTNVPLLHTVFVSLKSILDYLVAK